MSSHRWLHLRCAILCPCGKPTTDHHSGLLAKARKAPWHRTADTALDFNRFLISLDHFDHSNFFLRQSCAKFIRTKTMRFFPDTDVVFICILCRVLVEFTIRPTIPCIFGLWKTTHDFWWSQYGKHRMVWINLSTNTMVNKSIWIVR